MTVLFATMRPPEAALLNELATEEFDVEWAGTLRCAAQVLARTELLLAVVTDLVLPDGNWRDLVETVRGAGVEAPIMLVSATLSAELWWDALECGVEEVVCGPAAAVHVCREIYCEDLLRS